MEAEPPEPGPAPPGLPALPAADGDAIERAAALLGAAERPGDHGRHGPLLGPRRARAPRLAEELGIPVFLNGLARGCVPPDHELFFSRARGAALKGADVALVIGVPMDFRLGFGDSFGEDTDRDRDRHRAEPARRTRARSRPSCTARCPRRSTRCARARPAAPTAPAGSPSCARSRPSAAPPSGRS